MFEDFSIFGAVNFSWKGLNLRLMVQNLLLHHL